MAGKSASKLALTMLFLNGLLTILLVLCFVADLVTLVISMLGGWLALIALSMIYILLLEWRNHKWANQLIKMYAVIIIYIICYLIIIAPLIYFFVESPKDNYSNGINLSGLVIYLIIWLVKQMVLKKLDHQESGRA